MADCRLRVSIIPIDFEKLAQALDEFFPYGPKVKIQVPNDTIDQVSVHITPRIT